MLAIESLEEYTNKGKEVSQYPYFKHLERDCT